MQFAVNRSESQLNLRLTGPGIRIDQSVPLPFTTYIYADYDMLEFAKRVKSRNPDRCSFQTGILGEICMMDHPPLIGDVFGPVVTMLNGELIFHMGYECDRQFCVGLLTEVANQMRLARGDHFQSAEYRSGIKMEAVTATVLDHQDLIRIRLTEGEFRIPKVYADQLIDVLCDIWTDPIRPRTIPLSAHDDLTIADIGRFRMCVLRYGSPDFVSVANLYYELIPQIVNQIQRMYFGPQTSMFAYQFEDRVPEAGNAVAYHAYRTNRPLAPHDRELHICNRNVMIRVPMESIRGEDIYLRRIVAQIRDLKPHTQQVRLGLLNITVDVNPPATVHEGPYLSINNRVYFDLLGPYRDDCIELINCLTQVSCEEYPLYGNLPLAKPVYNVVRVSDANEVDIDITVAGPSHVVTRVSKSAISDRLIEMRFYFDSLLALSDEVWARRSLVGAAHGSAETFAIHTTGNYREVALGFISGAPESRVVLGMDYIVPFLRGFNDYLIKSGKPAVPGLAEFEEKFAARFNYIPKPKTKENSVPAPVANAVSWTALSPDNQRAFRAYMMTAPTEVRQLISSIALIDAGHP